MKLLDKFKDLFMDDVVEDEEVDVPNEEEEEVKEVYQEPKKDILPKVMREEFTESNIVMNEKPLVMEKEPVQQVKEETKKFNFNFDFNEPPTRESRNSELNKLEPVKPVKPVQTPQAVVKEKKKSELYPAKEENWVKPKFKASPVISPVYGILDKNYKKEEVKEKKEEKASLKRPSKKVDFETVRRKAFGNLSDEITDSMCENCELYKEAMKNSMIQEDNLLYDMTVEDKKEDTIEKAYNNYEEFGVVYEPEVEKEEEVIETSEDTIKEEIPTRESIKEEKVEVKEDTKVDDDFFKLIDSMYKERSDE